MPTVGGVGSVTPSTPRYSVEDADGAGEIGSRRFVLSRTDAHGRMAVVAQLMLTHDLVAPKTQTVDQMMTNLAIFSASIQEESAKISESMINHSRDRTRDFSEKLAKKMEEASAMAEKMAKKQKHNKFWKTLAGVFSVAATVLSLGTATPLTAGIIVGTLALGVATNAVMNSKFAKEHPKFAKVVMYASIAVQITASLVTLRLASAGAGVSKIANAADDAARLGAASKQAASTGMLMAEAENGAQMADDLVNGVKSASQTLDKGKQAGDAAEATKELSRLEKMTRYMDTGVAYGSIGTNTAKAISTVDLAVTTGKHEKLEADVDDIDKWMSFYRKKMEEMIDELKDELSAVQSAVFNASKASSTLNKSAMKVSSHIGGNPRGAI